MVCRYYLIIRAAAKPILKYVPWRRTASCEVFALHVCFNLEMTFFGFNEGFLMKPNLGVGTTVII